MFQPLKITSGPHNVIRAVIDVGNTATTFSTGAKYLIIDALEKFTWGWLFVTDWYFCNLYRLLTQIEISFLVDPNSD